ncbi:TPA: hypothetical protein ACK3AV_005515, partial [Klebsiella pneumoniae]
MISYQGLVRTFPKLNPFVRFDMSDFFIILCLILCPIISFMEWLFLYSGKAQETVCFPFQKMIV